MKPNLKPCPFCGDKSETYIIELNGLWYAGCDYCTCEVCNSDKQKAINNWNTRYDEPTIKKTLLLIVNIAVYSVVLAICAALAWNFYQFF